MVSEAETGLARPRRCHVIINGRQHARENGHQVSEVSLYSEPQEFFDKWCTQHLIVCTEFNEALHGKIAVVSQPGK